MDEELFPNEEGPEDGAEGVRIIGAEEAEKADWAVVYYAGHGFEIGGVNYLVPVDAKLAADKDAEAQAVALEQVIAAVGAASSSASSHCSATALSDASTTACASSATPGSPSAAASSSARHACVAATSSIFSCT